MAQLPDEGKNLDKISQLPVEIILRILSLMDDTKQCARTSIFSKHWRHLWTECQSLRFSFPVSPGMETIPLRIEAAKKYVVMVDSCIKSVRALTLDIFSVDLWLPTSSSQAKNRANVRVVNRWFHFARKKKARQIYVMARTIPGVSSKDCRIPASIFSCRAVTKLHVSFSTIPAVPYDFRGFRNLKILYIGCGVVANTTMADLLSNCPALESLSLVGNRQLNHVVVTAPNSPNLRHIFLQTFWDSTLAASIEAPNLQRMEFHSDLLQLNWKDSNALVEAILIGHNGTGYETKDDWIFDTKEKWADLMQQVSGVSSLTVNNWFFQYVIDEPSLFKNLKKLKCRIDWITGYILVIFTADIIVCPVLENLSIEFGYRARDSAKDTYCKTLGISKKNFPQFFDDFLMTVGEKHEIDRHEFPEESLKVTHRLPHLRTVSLDGFLGSKHEMILVKFLLKNAVSLEKFMVVDFFNRTKEELQLLFAPILEEYKLILSYNQLNGSNKKNSSVCFQVEQEKAEGKNVGPKVKATHALELDMESNSG